MPQQSSWFLVVTPKNIEKGKMISDIPSHEDGIIFHAGTANKDGKLVTNGGRVIAITSFGTNFKNAVDQVFR